MTRPEYYIDDAQLDCLRGYDYRLNDWGRKHGDTLLFVIDCLPYKAWAYKNAGNSQFHIVVSPDEKQFIKTNTTFCYGSAMSLTIAIMSLAKYWGANLCRTNAGKELRV